MPKVYKYRIHPSIGVARIGNSDEFYDGPEVVDPDWVPPAAVGAPTAFRRDAAGKIRRQAAIFHIYEFEYPNTTEANKVAGKPSRVREITMNEAKIEWSVELANRKALNSAGAKAPIVAPKTILNAKNAPPHDLKGAFSNGVGPLTSVLLGQIATEAAGRLRVLGAHGLSDSPGIPLAIGNYKHNNGWYDDIADGPVKAKLDFTGLPNIPAGVAGVQTAESAWVVTAAPDFAHMVEHVVSFYDLAYSIAVKDLKLPRLSNASFVDDIYPILHKAMLAHWTSDLLHVFFGGSSFHHFEPATFGSPAFRAQGATRLNLLRNANKTPGSPELNARQEVFSKLRNPVGGDIDLAKMPRLLKDDTTAPAKKLPLTKFHYKLFKKWSEGDFDADWPPPAPAKKLSDLPSEKQPHALDETHMRSMVGGAFFPGIEVGKNVEKKSTWSAPFRIKDTLPAGTLTETLAMPWQADFFACAAEDDGQEINEWWPSHRPITVLPGSATDYDTPKFVPWVPPATITSMLDMASKWHLLGFLKKKPVAGFGDLYVRTEPD